LWFNLILTAAFLLAMFNVGSSGSNEYRDTARERFQDAAVLEKLLENNNWEENKVTGVYRAGYTHGKFSLSNLKKYLLHSDFKNLKTNQNGEEKKLSASRNEVQVEAAVVLSCSGKKQVQVKFYGEEISLIKKTARDILSQFNLSRNSDFILNVEGTTGGDCFSAGHIKFLFKKLHGELIDKNKTRNSINMLLHSPLVSHRGVPVQGKRANLNLLVIENCSGGKHYFSIGIPFVIHEQG